VIQRIIDYSVQNRFVVVAIVLAVALWGVYSIARTPIDAIPDLSENQVIVFADWMGRSPQEIEDQVTYPLSVNLQGLAGVKAVRSTSEFNFSMVNIIFEDGIDFYFARERVLERLSVAATFLPEGVVPYMAPDATALGQIFWYTVEGGGKDPGELRTIQDWYVRYQLNSVPGVAQVASVGGFIKTYEISLDPNKLRAYGVTLGEVASAVERSNSAVGGNVYVKNGAEYLVRGIGWIRGIEDIRKTVVTQRGGVPITVGALGTVQIAAQERRSVLEKNGGEAVGGVVLMRYGENPLKVTERIKQKIADLGPGLPDGVRIVPFYDRTRLINEAMGTVTRALLEAMLIGSIAVLLILSHAGSALVVVLTLPLAVLISFILMRVFNIPSNIMSLSGIAISIGILVDSSIVMVENATHELTAKFGTAPVRGDTRPIVAQACRLVGRPIFFSIMIIVISFLPVFALSGQEGKMFHPLAFTKTFAMIGVALLSITLVPALLPIFLRGRLRSEEENPIVRSVIAVYRPVLQFLLRHRKAFVLSFVALLGVGYMLARNLGREFMPPLDEGSILEMPVTIPSASVPQAAGDLKVRDEILRTFPEVEMVVGKAGRADTPTDPAPPDMIETIINVRPRDLWPKRKVRFEDVEREAREVLAILEKRGAVLPASADDNAAMLNEASMDASVDVDRILRREAKRAQTKFEAELEAERIQTGTEAGTKLGPARGEKERDKLWRKRAKSLNYELSDRAGPALARALGVRIHEKAGARSLAARQLTEEDLSALEAERLPSLNRRLFLWRKEKSDLIQEMDSELQMPGWGNIWTQPIINRVDMLATGVRTMVGVKVYGDDLYGIQKVSEEIAQVLRGLPGAVDVFPDQIVGENYLDIEIDRERAARYGVNAGDVNEAIDVALGGMTVTTTIEGRERFPVRVRYARDFRADEREIGGILVNAMSGPAAPHGGGSGIMNAGGLAGPTQIPLREVASIRVVQGPSMIKSENGLLRSYVQLNVRGRDVVGFVEEAQKVVREKVSLPKGYYIEWSGQFEHQMRAKKTLQIVFPAVIALIILILYLTFHDLAQAMLMVLAIPGALAGGVIFQTLFGFNFSVAVWVGYIAAFGMATETGIVMMVYLRDALERKGGLAAIREESEITDAVMRGAVHRLRPKLLTEGTTIVGLMPLLWAHGTGAEVIRPMVAPVLGGLLVADEVIDLLLPVLFHWLQTTRWRRTRARAAAASG